MTSDPSASTSRNTPRLPLDVVDRVDRICDRFDGAWRAGQHPRIEDYLVEEEATTRPVLFRELLAAEVERRLRLGEQLTLGEYLERFPDRATEVGEVLTELGLTDGVASRPGDGLEALTFADDTLRASPTLVQPGSAVPPSLPTIPGYEVLGELGRGGMGVVYQAREVRLNRIVALKMILAGAHASPETAVRFLNEAEVVARLRHPNIVQIFAMGDHEGRPFVELEYVEGGNLARSIDGTPRPAPAAAALIEVLARTVHEAHRRGIIHRDLKPSNVLLTADGEPKVADFGLAKAIDCDSGLTRSDLVLGSPSYMAPEQAGGHARSVGVSADVYALGAIFYELLTGRPPFLAATALATLELVRTVEAVPPSRFQPDLPRDAETICLKCLEKDPAKRYPTAEAFAEDVRRYLDGRPIAARPVGPAGRFWRWCRREPRVAALLLLLALTFVTGFVGVAWALHRARTEAALARTERNSAVEARGRAEANFTRAEANFTRAEANFTRAEANFRKARELVESLSGIARTIASRPELDKTRRAILEKVVEFHESFLEQKSDDPALIEQSATSYEHVGHIRQELGQRERAAQAYTRSGELYDRLLARDPSNPSYRSKRAWAHFWSGRSQVNNESNFTAAQASYEKAVEITKRLVDESPKTIGHRSALALFLTNWAALRLQAGDRAEAEGAYKHVIELQREILVASPGNSMVCCDLALALDGYTTLLSTTNRSELAESSSREAVSLLQGVLAPEKGLNFNDSYLARYQSHLARILQQRGRTAEAESWSRQAYLGYKALVETFPDVVDYRLALSEATLAYARSIDTADRRTEARALYRSGLALRKKLADEFPENPTYLNDFAWALVSIPDATLHDPGKAVRLATKAVAIAPRNAAIWNTLGVAHYRAGDSSAAVAALEKSVQLRRQAGDLAEDGLFLAMAFWKLGEKAKARAWYDRAVTLIEETKNGGAETRGFRAEAEALLTGSGRE